MIVTGDRTRSIARVAARGVWALPIGHRLTLAAAALSFAASVLLWFGGDRQAGLFVGLWVPSILSTAHFLDAARRAHE
jgi:hypothetical protein